MSTLPAIQPIPMRRINAPFSDADWLFELKYDGFRALAYVDRGSAALISRRGLEYGRFAALQENVAQSLPGRAILDGEIVCLGPDGRTEFNQLMFRRGTPRFIAFDSSVPQRAGTCGSCR